MKKGEIVEKPHVKGECHRKQKEYVNTNCCLRLLHKDSLVFAARSRSYKSIVTATEEKTPFVKLLAPKVAAFILQLSADSNIWRDKSFLIIPTKSESRFKASTKLSFAETASVASAASAALAAWLQKDEKCKNIDCNLFLLILRSIYFKVHLMPTDLLMNAIICIQTYHSRDTHAERVCCV